MTFVVIPSTDVDAKSPIDDLLMGTIKQDLDDLNSRVIAAGAKTFFFEVGGSLAKLRTYKRSIGIGILNEAYQPSVCRMHLKKSGISGTLAIDIRKHTQPRTPITEIAHQYSGATTGIAQTGTAINTQSIARSTAQISTQSITHAKAALNVQSIINVGGNSWQYNVDAAIDSDTLVGDSIVTAGCTTGANNGTFVIAEIGRCGGNNFVVTNASGVAQTSAAGTAQIKIMSYNFTNPVSTEFAAGEIANFASHTTGANNTNAIAIFKINQSGNNIWIKNPSGATQGAAAGTADVNRWKYATSSAVSTTDYVVGEKAKMASHTTGANNGNFTITAVNLGGNNVTVYNSAGATQAGVAGTINTNRWTYSMPTDPSSQISVGQTVYNSGHTSAANDGTYTVKEVNRSAANNVVVYNESGVAQGGSAGTLVTTRKLVKFAADQSSVYTVTTSYVELQGCPSGLYNFADGRSPFQVLEVNRGGGANYNIVIDNPTGPAQSSPAGYVQTEMKSIFTSAPSIAASVSGAQPNSNLTTSTTSMVTATIAANTPLMLYITDMMLGDVRDLTVVLN